MFAIQPQILQVGGTARYHFCSFFNICSKSRSPFCKLCICLFRTTSLVCRFRIPMTFCKLGPMQRTLTGSSRQDTVWAGTFWDVLNVSLRASRPQLGLDLTCFVVRHLSLTGGSNQPFRHLDFPTFCFFSQTC